MDDQATHVLIADDQPQVCSALQLLLDHEPGIAVVGKAADMEQALELIGERRPDLVLLDWELPGQNGISALAGLRAARPGLMVVVLSGVPEAREAALTAGADAFVSKVEPPEQLLEAISDCFNKKGKGVES